MKTATLFVALICALVAADVFPQALPTPEPSATAIAEATPEPTPTPEPTATPEATPTPAARITYVPNPEVLRNPFEATPTAPWLIAEIMDDKLFRAIPMCGPDVPPETMTLRSKHAPAVTRNTDGTYTIKFAVEEIGK